MPKKDSVLIACVIDRSGSMQAILDDAVGGFNAFLKGQKEDTNGECNMTLAMFDNEYELRYDNVPVEDVREFTNASYCPRGSTALFDAVGKTINNVGASLDALPEEEKPEKVIFVILTDGQENSSIEFNIDTISTLIKQQQEEWNWEFIYLAADQEGFDAGVRMGFQNSTRYDSQNTSGAYGVVNCAVSHYRAEGSVEIDKDIS